VLSVADAFDAMTSNRSYRGARPVVEAIAELRKCAGQQFDPAFVDAFVAAIERDGWTGPNPIPVQATSEVVVPEILPEADGEAGPLISESM